MAGKSTGAVKKRGKKSKDGSKKMSGDGNKVKKKRSKVSEETKARQEEQRAAIEEERRRLREELVASFLRHKLSREEETLLFNRAKLLTKWRQTMRDSKNQELQKLLMEIKSDFENRLKSNETKIAKLVEAIEENVRNQKSVSERHQEAISEAIEMHMKQLSLAQQNFVEERRMVENEIFDNCDKFRREKTQIVSRIHVQVQKSQDTFARCFQERQQEFTDYRDEIINKGLEETQSIRMNLERLLEQKWKEMFQVAPDATLDRERWQLYSTLVKKDTAYSIEHTNDKRKIDLLNSKITRYNEILKNLERSECEENVACEQFLEQSQELQKKYRKQLRDEEKSCEALKTFSSESRETIEFLEGCLQKVTGVLRLAQRCDLRILNETKSCDGSLAENSLRNEEIYEQLQIFWSKFNAALLECLALKRYSLKTNSAVEETKLDFQITGTKKF